MEFYYLWKKTPGANNNRPHRRRRQGSLRRIRNTRNSRGANTPPTTGRGGTATETDSRPSPQPGKEPGETSSVTEDDNSEDDSDSRDAQYKCQHCFTTNSKDWQTAGKDRQLLCCDCRAYLKKTNELPPTVAPAASATKESTPIKDGACNKEAAANGKNEKDSKEPAYLFRPVAESPDASPQRMRTRNKAAKEQNSNRARPKRGGTETPEPKTPSKQSTTSPADKNGVCTNQPGTPVKKKGKIEKIDTPSKSRKRGQERNDETESEEKELGLFKKKRDRAEVKLTRKLINWDKMLIFIFISESIQCYDRFRFD